MTDSPTLPTATDLIAALELVADNGLLVGVQIVGSFLSDRTTMAFARAADDALGGLTPPPQVNALLRSGNDGSRL